MCTHCGQLHLSWDRLQAADRKECLKLLHCLWLPNYSMCWDRYPAGCLLCSSSTLWSREKERWFFHPPFYRWGWWCQLSSHTRNVVSNPTWYLGSQSQRLQGLCKAPSGPVWAGEHQLHTLTRSTRPCSSWQGCGELGTNSTAAALQPHHKLEYVSGSSKGLWDGGLCEQSTCGEQEIIISLEATGLVS